MTDGDGVPVWQIKAQKILEDFLRELRYAARKSERNGGAYAAHLNGSDGKAVLRIEVQFPIGGQP